MLLHEPLAGMTVTILVSQITDWTSFHDVFQQALGFPNFYGRNMDAWIDCLTSADSPEDGMMSVSVPKHGLLVLRLDEPLAFQRRCPEQYAALVECCAFVNLRRVQRGEDPVLALLPDGLRRQSR